MDGFGFNGLRGEEVSPARTLLHLPISWFDLSASQVTGWLAAWMALRLIGQEIQGLASTWLSVRHFSLSDQSLSNQSAPQLCGWPYGQVWIQWVKRGHASPPQSFLPLSLSCFDPSASRLTGWSAECLWSRSEERGIGESFPFLREFLFNHFSFASI